MSSVTVNPGTDLCVFGEILDAAPPLWSRDSMDFMDLFAASPVHRVQEVHDVHSVHLANSQPKPPPYTGRISVDFWRLAGYKKRTI